MTKRILNLLLIISSLFGYIEWGGNNRSFLFQAEQEILLKLLEAPLSALHPFTILPMIGQIVLVITLFQKNVSKYFTYIGLGLLSILMVFIFIVGFLSLNVKIILSTLPFIALSVITVRQHRS